MTVKELIQLLEKCGQDKSVHTLDKFNAWTLATTVEEREDCVEVS